MYGFTQEVKGALTLASPARAGVVSCCDYFHVHTTYIYILFSFKEIFIIQFL